MNTYSVQGYYGSDHIPCEIFVLATNGPNWYCAEGSTNINATYDDIELGVNIESIYDIDTINWDHPIMSEDELMEAVLS